MKNIFLFIAFLFCTSLVFAQSSVSDVPAKTVTPAKTNELVISSTNTVVQPVAKNKVTGIDNTGSVALTPSTKIATKPADISGSIAPVKDVKVERKVAIENKINSTNSIKPVEVLVQQPVENLKPNSVQTVNEVAKPLLPISVSTANAELISDIAPASKVVNTTKLPEVKIDNSKQLKLEEVPASVINPAIKASPVPMQGAEKVKTKNKE